LSPYTPEEIWSLLWLSRYNAFSPLNSAARAFPPSQRLVEANFVTFLAPIFDGNFDYVTSEGLAFLEKHRQNFQGLFPDIFLRKNGNELLSVYARCLIWDTVVRPERGPITDAILKYFECTDPNSPAGQKLILCALKHYPENMIKSLFPEFVQQPSVEDFLKYYMYLIQVADKKDWPLILTWIQEEQPHLKVAELLREPQAVKPV
jgi:hypothetical protein